MSIVPQGLTNERVPSETFGRSQIRNFHKLPPWNTSRLIEITLAIFILVVIVSNFLPRVADSKGGSLLFGYFNNNNNNNVIQTSEEYFLGSKNYQTASFASLARRAHILGPTNSTEFAEQEYQLVTTTDKNFLVNPLSPLTTASGEPRAEIIIYEVQVGDNPSTIAASFGITTNTLLWTNSLGFWDYIRPGDELKIMPVSGVVHEVKTNDTIEAIAKKYRADSAEIISFNELPADGKIEPGQELIIPDGVKFVPQPTRVYATYSPERSKGGHRFPWGQCTWYVATKRYVPWSGHAKQWLVNAKAYGFQVCWGSSCAPQPGAIVSLTDSGWAARLYGHVAYVEKVTVSTITISEMNRIGLGVRSIRVLARNSWRIRGYIY